MDATNRQIAALYGGVVSQPLDRFQDFALARLRAVVPFDSAVWACGENDTSLQNSLHLVNQRLDDLMMIAVRRRGEDVFRDLAMARPGIPVCIEDTMPMAAYRRLPLYLNVLQRIGIEHAMGLRIADPINNLANYLVVYRADRTQPFSAGDRAAQAMMIPHILEAWRHCQFNTLLGHNRPVPDVAGAFLHGRAITDSFGTISQADPGFGTALASEFPAWSGTQLPHEVTGFVRSDTASLRLGALRFTIARGSQHHVVSVMGTVRGSLLGAAELDVARRVVAGESRVRIAAARGVSGATIRNQVARIYEKLGIHSKVELIQAFRSLQPG